MTGFDLTIIGLGYVGMPLAKEATAAGLRVAGLDVDPHKIEELKAGRSYIDDLTDGDLDAMLSAGFTPTVDPSVLAGSSTIVICVPTPLDEDRRPDLSAVVNASRTVAGQLRPGTLVVLESTTWPGTTDEVVRPILEESGLRAGVDFHLAFSPERIDPGNPKYGVRNTPKVVGGYTEACRERACAFYSRFIERVVPVSGTREAEMAKLLENTYRHVNIALVNEMAIFCDELGVNLWEAIEAAATKPFGFQKFLPGPGVGGHCIPVDPSYLSYTVRKLGYPFRFVELAQEINERMPSYVVTRVQRLLNRARKPVNGSHVVLLGVTYKPDISDTRETPAVPVAEALLELGADLSYCDPFVKEWSVKGRVIPRRESLEEAVEEADVAVLLQQHSAFDLDTVERKARLVLDTRGVLTESDRVERL
ncbi:UDP-N-acetyl-D-glucosamine dehydrogenase [Thermobispora bispora]|uniref:Nucleotide sugar dehydrogenase n=1 Tax=Thermobispora bispora (strain ATCC 19993 / DSM 43833 / CBS 139.67 / JCM 10125 / KCTC 9307 / NBRC 14880 / R51) TaxID=469371 RepID=D6Y2T3_THEBD|nr:nucleotide sugar dehydrogenase [Thermobispora bispora]ADG86894.1 nucleotide sugar dehydrogenase [Thermobispora bispora DSM 43833]MBO2475108.1 nucleotide sugar dehydrogenase [Actinomycetales bacterium]MBX6166134.1 nucleotide sugar dehydrogenase [Thermobispora bispora]QSI46883.1 nucleotide sugar dehydrogenase [Thermobispora bispora]